MENLKESILAKCAKNCGTDVELISIPAPFNEDEEFKFKPILNNTELTKITEAVDFKIKNKRGVLDEYSDETIECAVWFQHCFVEPSFTFDEALMIAQGSGYWTNSAIMFVKKECGISTKLLSLLSEEFKNNPFVDSSTKPV